MDNVHALSFNSSKPITSGLAPLKHSTRNNSISEVLLQENVSITNLSKQSVTIDANLFKYTCLDCNFATTEKAKLNDHVVKHHDCTGIRNLNFKCITCNCEFDGEELYQSHVKTHDVVTVEQPQVQDCTAENHTILKCKECSYVSENNSELNKHVSTTHGQPSDILKEKQSEAKEDHLHLM